MMLLSELVTQEHSPGLLRRGTFKAEGEFAGAWRSVRRSAIGDVDFGGSRKEIRGQRDLDFSGVPSIQHDRVELVSQEQSGDLQTGQRGIGRGCVGFQGRIVMRSQGHQDVVGTMLQLLMFRRLKDRIGV